MRKERNSKGRKKYREQRDKSPKRVYGLCSWSKSILKIPAGTLIPANENCKPLKIFITPERISGSEKKTSGK